MIDKYTKIVLTVIAVGLWVPIVQSINLVQEAQADVAGMSYRDLRRDRDFKKAVKYVVNNSCSVDGGSIYC